MACPPSMPMRTAILPSFLACADAGHRVGEDEVLRVGLDDPMNEVDELQGFLGGAARLGVIRVHVCREKRRRDSAFPPARDVGVADGVADCEILPAAFELLRDVLVGVDDDRALVEPRRALLEGLRRAGGSPRRGTTRGRARARGPARRRSFSCAGGYNSAMRTPPRFQPLDFERLSETEMTRRSAEFLARIEDPPHRPGLLGRARAFLADRERRAAPRRSRRRGPTASRGDSSSSPTCRSRRPSASPRRPRRRRATNAACPRSGSKLSLLWARTGTSRFWRRRRF